MSSNRNTGATNRLKQDYLRLKGDPIPYVVAEPVPANILECSVAEKFPPTSLNLRRNRSQIHTNNSAKCGRSNELLRKCRKNRDLLRQEGGQRPQMYADISTKSQRCVGKSSMSQMCSNKPLICYDSSDKAQKYAVESDKARKYAVESDTARKYAIDSDTSRIWANDSASSSIIDLDLSDSPMSQFDSSDECQISPPVSVSKSSISRKKDTKKTIRRYNSAPKEKIEKVVHRIHTGKITISEASRLYNISKGTLINRIHKKHQKKFGRPNTLTSLEEKKLAECVKKLCDFGFSLTIVDIQVLATFENRTKLLKKNSRFGIQWSRSFVARHDLNSLKRWQSMNIYKNLALKEDAYAFLEHVKSTLNHEETAVSPDCIFSFEEFHLSGDPQSNQFVMRKNLRYPVQTPTEKSCVSVMFCGNASGSWLPFYVVKKSSENESSCNISKSTNLDESANDSYSPIVCHTNEALSQSKSGDCWMKSNSVHTNEENTNSTIFFVINEDSNASSVVNTCSDVSRSTNLVNKCYDSLNSPSVNNTDCFISTNVFDVTGGSVKNDDVIPDDDNSASTIFVVVNEGSNSKSVVSKKDDISISTGIINECSKSSNTTSVVETNEDSMIPTSVVSTNDNSVFFVVDDGSNSTPVVSKSSETSNSTKVDNVNEDNSNSINEISNLQFGASKSGWFDSDVFADWFEHIFIKSAAKCGGKILLICDNVPRNINSKTVKLAEENNVEFVVVPNNLRRWCQPFSGDFTKSLGRNWSDIVENWSGERSTDECLSWEDFPPLIEKLVSRLFQDNGDTLLSSDERMASLSDGFERCGIWPLNPDRVISKIPNCEENELSYKDFNVELQNDDVFLVIKY